MLARHHEHAENASNRPDEEAFVATSDIVVLQAASLAASLVVVSVLLSVQEAVVVVVHGFTVATPHDNGVVTPHRSSILTSTHPTLMLLALACTQVHGFFSQPNLGPGGRRFCETY